MINTRLKKLISKGLILIAFLMLLPSFCYANTYSNNSISIEVTPEKRTYDYKEDVGINIKIENKNRYAKLHYKIKEVYTGGGFRALNLLSGYQEIAPLENKEFTITMHDNFITEEKNKTIGHKIKKIDIGRHAYEVSEEEVEDFKKYRKEKTPTERISSNKKVGRLATEKESFTRGANAILLIIIIVVLICIFLVIFIWYIVKAKSSGGSKYLSIVLIIGLLAITMNNKIYAADTYQENVHYNKEVNTRCTYWDLDCSFNVQVEYYFENTIAPITNLELDTDNDNLPDYLEVLYLTDLNNSDTDNDGIPDGVEVYYTYTDPNREDTDNNGVNDGDEDYDKDGLTNKEEVNCGTRPDEIDTDFDSLSDYDEINGVKTKNGYHTYQTDPTSDDTDGDELRDDVELKLNLNPTNPSDANTRVSQEMSKDLIPNNLSVDAATPVSFKGEVKGLIDENVKVRLSTNTYFEKERGTIGEPIVIDTTYGSSDGLKLVYDVSKYNNIKNRLMLCKYVDGILKLVENSYLSGNTIIGDVSSGEYVLVDSKVILQATNIFY